MKTVHIGEVSRIDLTMGRSKDHIDIWLRGEDHPWFVRAEALHIEERRFVGLKEFLDWIVDIFSQDNKVVDATFEVGDYGAVVEASFISKEIKHDPEPRLGR